MTNNNIKNYYDMLGVSQDATLSDIKTAYRYLAKKYHPDRNTSQNSSDMFIKYTEAYEILRDPIKRKAYDSLLKTYKEARSFEDSHDEQESYGTWKRQARNQANSYANMKYEHFLQNVLNVMERTADHGIHYGRIAGIIYIRILGGGLLSLAGIAMIFKGTNSPLISLLFALGGGYMFKVGIEQIRDEKNRFKRDTQLK